MKILFIPAAVLCIAVSALNSSCTKDKVAPFNPALSDTVSFSLKIEPLVMQNCATSGCHDAGTAQSGYNLTTHANVAASAGDMLNAMRGQNGFTPMPLGGPMLADTLVQQFEAWIAQGKQNN